MALVVRGLGGRGDALEVAGGKAPLPREGGEGGGFVHRPLGDLSAAILPGHIDGRGSAATVRVIAKRQRDGALVRSVPLKPLHRKGL